MVERRERGDAAMQVAGNCSADFIWLLSPKEDAAAMPVKARRG
jgi:hypothetical protein